MTRKIVLSRCKSDDKVLSSLKNELRELEFSSSLEEIIDVENSFIILYSWPTILSEEFINKQTCVLNVHNSLLPKYRGRHAFTWAMINGEKEVGYTLHKVDGGIDTGDIYAQLIIPVDSQIDINTLFEIAETELASWLPSKLIQVIEKKAMPKKQNNNKATYFRARRPEDSMIDLSQSYEKIYNFIRAQRPPYTKGAYLEIHGSRLYFGEVKKIPSGTLKNKDFIINDDISIIIRCLDAEIELYRAC